MECSFRGPVVPNSCVRWLLTVLDIRVGPVIAGGAAKWTGSAAAAIDIGAATIIACPVLLWFFNRLATNATGRANAVAR